MKKIDRLKKPPVRRVHLNSVGEEVHYSDDEELRTTKVSQHIRSALI